MHHRRNPKKPLTTRGTKSRIVTIRIPYELEDALKEVAEARGRPWQTVMKDLLAESLGLSSESLTEVKHVSAKNIKAAVKRLRKN